MNDTPSIGILTFYSSVYEEFGKVAALNNQKYALSNGYQFYGTIFEYNQMIHWMQRPAAWMKVKYWQQHLGLHDWLFWIDSDAIFVDFKRRIEDFLDPAYDIIVAADENGINTGTLILKNSEWTRLFLDRVWNEAVDINHGWWEQKSMMDLMLDPEVAAHIKVLNTTEINDTTLKPGTFIVHLAGSVLQQNRKAELEKYLALIQ